MATDTERAKSQARAQLESIIEMVAALGAAGEDDNAREQAEETIREDPLSVEVRSGWHTPGEESAEGEYSILLCTGGPAVRLIGELQYGQPDTVRLEYQDWFTEWKTLPLSDEESEAALRYAGQFYYGD